VDASINKEGLKMGVGILIRNEDGGIVAARALQIPFVVDPLQAEALASWYGVSFGREMGGTKVILEGDSLVVMLALMREEVRNQAHGLLLEDIRSTFSNFLSLEVHHIQREANMAAHVLAKYALSRSLDKIWLGECPPFILSIVLAKREVLSA
jgi:ribonuclease HI